MQGRWAGRFPLEGAKACETRLLADGAAVVQCDGTAIVGRGSYRWDGSRLTVELPVLTYGGKKVRPPAPFVFRVDGRGNVLRASYERMVYEWRRTMR